MSYRTVAGFALAALLNSMFSAMPIDTPHLQVAETTTIACTWYCFSFPMRASFCCGAQIVFLRQCMVFLALNHRAFCLAGGHPHPGFVDTKLNSIENKVAREIGCQASRNKTLRRRDLHNVVREKNFKRVYDRKSQETFPAIKKRADLLVSHNAQVARPVNPADGIHDGTFSFLNGLGAGLTSDTSSIYHSRVGSQ